MPTRRFELHRDDDPTGVSGTGIVAHFDRSGIMSTWGPFATEAEAELVQVELDAIGVPCLFEVRPLRTMVPVRGYP